MRYPVVGLIGLLLALLPWALIRHAADDQAVAQNPASKPAAPKAPAEAVAAHPVVPGFERFFAEEKSDAARGGQLLLSELNCTSCHLGDKADPAKMAPILSDVGGRIKPAFL